MLSLVQNKLEDYPKFYLYDKFFSNINKCNFQTCLHWFTCIFIYWFHSILDPELYNYKISYINFRKYFLKFRKNKNHYEITKEILVNFKKINTSFIYYEELKTFLNYSIFNIFDGYYKLP